MFWSEPGKDVRVPVDPHTIGPYLQTCFGLSQVEIQEFQEILILLTLPSDMFWSQPGTNVGVPIDPHTVVPYLQTCFGLSQVEM